MDPSEYYGALSLVPASVAILLAFLTRNTVFSLVMACLIGVVVSGQGLMGFPNLLKNALGNTNFSWVTNRRQLKGNATVFLNKP